MTDCYLFRGRAFVVTGVLVVALLSGCGGGAKDGSDRAEDSSARAETRSARTATERADQSSASTKASFARARCPARAELPGYTCGFLTVPEDRSDPRDGKIRVAVAIGPSTGRARAADPIVFLQGGPGFGGLLDPPPVLEILRRKRDVILVDQRGTGASKPSLNCWELDELALEALSHRGDDRSFGRRVESAIGACRARLVSKRIDLTAYNTASIAADVVDLRRALRYERWNLIGYSYGSRVALTVVRDFPQGVRSVVLDSSYPPNLDFYAGLAAAAERSFQLLFESCAAAPDCASRYPNLRARWLRVLERFERRPVREVADAPGGRRAVSVLFDSHAVSRYVRELLGSEHSLPYVPSSISAAESRRLDDIAADVVTKTKYRRSASDGLYLSVQCRDELRFTDRKAVARASANAPPEIGEPPPVDFRACELWDVPRAPPSEKEPVESDVPTLVLAGQFDPTTPPAAGRLAARTLTRSYFYEFPGLGHGVLYSRQGCPGEVITDFLDHPLEKPDASCIARMEPPDWR